VQAGTSKLKQVVSGLASTYPDRVSARFTLGLDEVELKSSATVQVEDPILAAVAAQIGLLDSKGAKKCVLVGKAYRCKIEPASHFDPESIRTVKAVHGSKLPAGVSVVTGCPQGEYDNLQGLCKVGTRAAEVRYSKDVCSKHEGCRV
jgi:hypothetical protein